MTNLNEQAAQKAWAHLQTQNEAIKDHPLRQHYHLEPPAGWCNDPNGVIFHEGKYHIFYQHMPYDADPGDYRMYWGHASSADLCRWEHHPPAICPSDVYDSGGCWSGSSFVHEGVFHVMYTGIDERHGRRQVQCMATSRDLVTFEKAEGNPILHSPPPGTNGVDFRDPKIWRHGEHWYMVLGSSSEDGFGRALLYRSRDLRGWEYVNDLAESGGELGPICECPDFFPLDGKYVLLLSPKGLKRRKVLYLVGEFDHSVGKLFWSALGEVDWGMDFYATQTLLDAKGRRIAFAWQNSWDWMPWCDGKYYTTPLGWCGGLALPRELHLDAEGRLISKPVSELENLRGEKTVVEGRVIPEGESFAFSVGDNVHCEWVAEFDLSAGDTGLVELTLRGGGERGITVALDVAKGELRFDRRNTLTHIPYLRRCPLRSAGQDKLVLHVFMDSSSIELFCDGYTTSMSNTVCLPPDATEMRVRAAGGNCVLKSLTGWPLQH